MAQTGWAEYTRDLSLFLKAAQEIQIKLSQVSRAPAHYDCQELMLLIGLPLYVLAALAGWALVGSQCYFAHPLCNPLPKEVSSLPRADHWKVSAVTMEHHFHVTLSSASSEALQVPTKAVGLPRFHPGVPVLTLPCSAPPGSLWECQAFPGFIGAAFQTDESFVSQIGKYQTPGVSSHS